MTALPDDLRAMAERLDGLFVGMLDEDELRTLEAAVKAGIARRSYDGAGGLMGLAKVRMIAPLALSAERKEGGHE